MYNNRVLVIDDEEPILDVFRSVLMPERETAGSLDALNRLLDSKERPAAASRTFAVDTATQGRAGYELFAAALEEGKPYAAVFVDMRMPPGWDGIRTIQAIHKLDPFAQIIVVTAYSDASVSEIVSMVGFTDRLLYLKKPFDDEEILQLADSLTMRWNLEAKVRRFVAILEGIFNSLAELDFTGNDEALRPFLQRVLQQVSDFLDTEDVFLAKVEKDGMRFRVGLGKFSNGITVRPAFLEMVQRALIEEKLEEIVRVDEYVVMPILLR
ncbi:MAG: response regulator, partial [Thermodesulfobacteriota bacterium]